MVNASTFSHNGTKRRKSISQSGKEKGEMILFVANPTKTKQKNKSDCIPEASG